MGNKLHRYTLDIEENFRTGMFTVTVYRNGEQVSETIGTRLNRLLDTASEHIKVSEDSE